MKKLCIIFILLTFSFTACAQLAYIYDDDKIVYDVELIDWDWSSNKLTLKQGETEKILTPATLSQFELVREGVFISTEIENTSGPKQVFLLKKISGNYNFYIYKQNGKERYFYKYKGAVTEVPSADGKYLDDEFIAEVNDNLAGCDDEKVVGKRVKLSNRALTKLFNFTNSPCDDVNFYISRGIVLAARGTQLSSHHDDNERYLNRTDFSDSYNLSGGIEYGLHFKRLSFITNLQYYQASFDSERMESTGEIFFEDRISIRQRGIQNDILARLKSVGSKYEGFVDIGFAQNVHLNMNRSVYNYYFLRGNTELVLEEKNTLFSNYQIHNVVRFGVSAPLDNVSSLTVVLGIQALTSRFYQGNALSTRSLFLAGIYDF